MCLQTQVGHNKGGVGETRTHQKKLDQSNGSNHKNACLLYYTQTHSLQEKYM